ncbi:MAG: ABC transporter ATP-binding protein [Acidimicrobiia bacterium]|nr:ABC transporter ATP-binding protein [Acidimicrobiia bacterium]
MLAVDVTTRRSGFELDMSFQVGEDEILGVVGPNGSGKTSLLRIVAGLDPAMQGCVLLDETRWADTGAGIWLPAERRSVGYVPQGSLLFPHMTALDNVGFGMTEPEKALAWLERLGISELAGARPAELSGGQAQLVALARAQARSPDVLLLDEPLASIDIANRASIRRIVRRELQSGRQHRIFVTHDPLEAVALADRILVVADGRVSQIGTVEDLRRHPRSRYVAELLGLNLFAGTARGGVIALADGAVLVAAETPDGPAFATVHPRAVSLYTSRPSGSPRNIWRAPVTAIERSLERVRIEVGGSVPIVAEVTPEGARGFREGDEVWVAIKASEVQAYPR